MSCFEGIYLFVLIFAGLVFLLKGRDRGEWRLKK